VERWSDVFYLLVFAGFYGSPGSFGFGVRASVAVEVCIGGAVGTSCVDIVFTLKSRALLRWGGFYPVW
jgi:hypothetical protein